MTVYNSPTCSCCKEEWDGYPQDEGFASCHTAIIGGGVFLAFDENGNTRVWSSY